jgi:hypothetical protein
MPRALLPNSVVVGDHMRELLPFETILSRNDRLFKAYLPCSRAS